MSTDPGQEEHLDIDLTDELPILIETAVLDSEERVTVAVADDETGEHTARYVALAAHEAESVAALKTDLELRAAKIEELERDIGRLSGRWLEIERHLVDKDAAITDLTQMLASTRAELAERSSAEERMAAEIVDRDNQFARLLDQLDLLRAEAANARAEVERQKGEQEIQREELAKSRAELERQTNETAAPGDQSLREELDALASYVANRRSWWDELEARADQQALRITELERELAQRTARQRQSESLAARETARADGLRAELVAEARRAETLDAALRKRGADPAVDRAAAAELGAARDALAALQRERDLALEQLAALRAAQLERDQRHAEEIALAKQHRAAAERAAQAAVEQLAASGEDDAGVSAAEVVAQLEAELEHKRAELIAERAVSHESRQRLTAATADADSARRQLAEARGQLEQMRSDAARIERSLIDKDRALEARDQRIRTLQSELDQKLGVLQKLSAMDVSLQGLDSKMSERLRRTDSPSEPPNAPALICLTSDAPRQYALAKKTMTIGRSSRCDIQILTHFVSREHARLIISQRGNVAIEDLGSTNGVFVNSVRIERQELHHGDLVTVGETQFRFLETMAH